MLNNISVWQDCYSRLLPETWPECSPTFKINKDDKIFTVGSCFVRNMEEHLIKYGCKVPMLDYISPKDEWPYRPNGILNKYSPASIYQELQWCEKIHLSGGTVRFDHIEKFLYGLNDDRVVDLHIGGFVPVTKERALKRRQQIYDAFSNCFSSKTILMTLGMVEVWYDSLAALYIQRYPTEEIFRECGQRFRFIRLNYKQCYDYIQKTISLTRNYSSDNKILLTTSPVPLERTFTCEDVITANTYSKSVLRAVCGEIVNNNINVDYFPAFETICFTEDTAVYKADRRHVSDEYIERIIQRVSELYLNQ